MVCVLGRTFPSLPRTKEDRLLHTEGAGHEVVHNHDQNGLGVINPPKGILLRLVVGLHPVGAFGPERRISGSAFPCSEVDDGVGERLSLPGVHELDSFHRHVAGVEEHRQTGIETKLPADDGEVQTNQHAIAFLVEFVASAFAVLLQVVHNETDLFLDVVLVEHRVRRHL
jgi:hypothetical protein